MSCQTCVGQQGLGDRGQCKAAICCQSAHLQARLAHQLLDIRPSLHVVICGAAEQCGAHACCAAAPAAAGHASLYGAAASPSLPKGWCLGGKPQNKHPRSGRAARCTCEEQASDGGAGVVAPLCQVHQLVNNSLPIDAQPQSIG